MRRSRRPTDLVLAFARDTALILLRGEVQRISTCSRCRCYTLARFCSRATHLVTNMPIGLLDITDAVTTVVGLTLNLRGNTHEINTCPSSCALR